MRALNLFDQARHPRDRRELSRPEAAAAGVGQVAAGLLHELIGVAQQVLGVRHQLFAQRRQRGAARAAAEQVGADGRFKFADALGQRRHRDIQPVGGNGEVLAGGGPVKGFKLLKRHGGAGRIESEEKCNKQYR
ncbi:hypothetical protein D3C72_1814570 [compost metagenome]